MVVGLVALEHLHKDVTLVQPYIGGLKHLQVTPKKQILRIVFTLLNRNE